MAVSKRTRFEVLRRDNNTCCYCGEKAPNVTLHVDHVMPKSLGGTDKPDNLVTACRDCNTGKASAHPDAALVAEVSDAAREYEEELAREAIKHLAAATRIRADYQAFEDFRKKFDEAWVSAGLDDSEIGYMSLFRWVVMGIPAPVLLGQIEAVAAKSLKTPFRYFAGIIWAMVKDNSFDSDYNGTHRPVVYTKKEARKIASYNYHDGYRDGVIDREATYASADFVACHVDGREGGQCFPGFDPEIWENPNGA